LFLFIYLIKKSIFNCRDDGYPGPQIGFLQEIVEWLDYYISGIDNGYQNKEILSIYQLYPNSCETTPIVNKRKGKWINLNQIPNYPNEDLIKNNNQIKYYLSFGLLTNEIILNNNSPKTISFLSPQETGISSGSLLGHGNILSPDNPIDQREDDGRSLTFDSLPLNNNYGKNYLIIYLFYFFFLLRIIWISNC